MRYRILRAPSPEELEIAVALAIREGWNPQGGMCFAYVNKAIYMQAVIFVGQTFVI